MNESWVEQRRNNELIEYIQTKNDMGIMPTTHNIYTNVDMARATANKYLVVLQAKGVLDIMTMGTTRIWYVARDEDNNTLIPKIVFVKKSEKSEKLI